MSLQSYQHDDAINQIIDNTHTVEAIDQFGFRDENCTRSSDWVRNGRTDSHHQQATSLHRSMKHTTASRKSVMVAALCRIGGTIMILSLIYMVVRTVKTPTIQLHPGKLLTATTTTQQPHASTSFLVSKTDDKTKTTVPATTHARSNSWSNLFSI
jgi:hypothetical protein